MLAKARLALRRYNCFFCLKDEKAFCWSLDKLSHFVAIHETLELKFERVKDQKCAKHTYQDQIIKLIELLPERFLSEKLNFYYDSAPNRCAKSFQLDLSK